MWKRFLGLFVTACSVVSAAAHGYMVEPAARNVVHNSDYCPQCLNGPEVCGDLRGRHEHEKGHTYDTPPTRTLRAGSPFYAHIVITANHQGRWGLWLCAAGKDTKKCFTQLKLSNKKSTKYVYVQANQSKSKGAFQLPRGVTCERCTLRWHWQTGNSCTPKGTPRRFANPHLETCGTEHSPPMETFTNCATIQIK